MMRGEREKLSLRNKPTSVLRHIVVKIYSSVYINPILITVSSYIEAFYCTLIVKRRVSL